MCFADLCMAIGAFAHYDSIPHVPYYTCTHAFLAGRRDQSGYGSTSREDGTKLDGRCDVQGREFAILPHHT